MEAAVLTMAPIFHLVRSMVQTSTHKTKTPDLLGLKQLKKWRAGGRAKYNHNPIPAIWISIAINK